METMSGFGLSIPDILQSLSDIVLELIDPGFNDQHVSTGEEEQRI